MMGTARLRGAQAVVRVLEEEGVRVAVGYIGHTVQELADALIDSPIRSLHPRTEMTGSFMVDGYNRVVRGVGAVGIWHCAGVPQALCGLANAAADSIPLVYFAGAIHSLQEGKGALQDTHAAELARPLTKWSVRVTRPELLADATRRAIRVATTGRPGPVLVEIPLDVAAATCDYRPAVTPGPAPRAGADEDDVRRAVALLQRAERPVVLAGGGTVLSGAADELRALVETLRAPVTTSAMGMAVFPMDHPLALPHVGVRGSQAARQILEEADVVLAVGYRFAEFGYAQGFSITPAWRLIQVDADAAEIGKNYPVEVGMVGDARVVLRQLAAALSGTTPGAARTAWIGRMQDLRERERAELAEKLADDRTPISPYRFIRELREAVPRDALVFTDCGNHQSFAQALFEVYEPYTFFNPGGYGHLGWGFPAALGAKLARPDHTVVALSGDGGFHYSMHELATMVAEDLPVVNVIMTDGYLNANRMLQQYQFDARFTWVKLNNPDFVKLADAFGVKGVRVDRPMDIKPAVQEAVASGEPWVIDVRIDPTIPPPLGGRRITLR